MDLVFVMFNKSMNFIRRLNREKFFSSQMFKIWWQISSIEVRKTQNFSSVSLKLWLLGQKNTGTWGVNTILIIITIYL